MKSLRALTAAAVLAVLVVIPASAADESKVRVLHASPDAPAVDVYLDGAKVDALVNVPFGAISDYLSIPAGSHQVTVYATGTTSSPVIDANLPFDAGVSYTIAATNALASIEAQRIVDDASPSTDGAQIRVVHFSADTPAVDVAPDGAPAADAMVKNLAYPDATDYLAVPAGAYDLEVRPTGTTTVALQLDPITVEAGKAYTVFAIGSGAESPVGGNAIRVLAAVDATAAAEPTPAPSAQPTAAPSTGSTATLPPTSTVDSTSDTQAPGLPVAFLIVAGLVAAAAVLALPLRAKARR